MTYLCVPALGLNAAGFDFSPAIPPRLTRDFCNFPLTKGESQRTVFLG